MASQRNIGVTLTFRADTDQAKAQIAQLQQTLSNVAHSAQTQPFGMTTEIRKATEQAIQLKTALQNATNADTGRLNLNKFMASLNKSKISVQDLGKNLARLGPEGVKAFNQMATAVNNADRGVISISAGLQKLGSTFMNTMRWQVASTAISAITSAVSQAVSFTKQLDESLNNIRKVTGKGADEMARFAKYATGAAKELSVSTTEYTNASLIYYQQGLNTDEVKKRTEITVKLANVLGESAETASEWMTSIWNNFDNGSKSLEHYADVLTALGAATASSADEIAGGLEKFAAIANTVGLSYEYAASALATITAETRQSEEVVGTALKTLFSRMEQLKLGETLDDGTSLGQYSSALAAIGVNIQDVSGELKDMDVILEETGAQWDNLSRSQKVALSQQVAGIRQYSQFMALMDNWDVMEKNLAISQDATGELQKQQLIYEQSAEAAEYRMKLAGEEIVQSLIQGEDLVNVYDTLAGTLSFVGDLVDAFGGLNGLLTIGIGLMASMFGPKIASAIQAIAINAKAIFNPGAANSFTNQVNATAMQINASQGSVEGQLLVEKNKMIQEMARVEKALSAEAKEQLNLEMQLYDKSVELTLEAEKRLKIAREEASLLEDTHSDVMDTLGGTTSQQSEAEAEEKIKSLRERDVELDGEIRTNEQKKTEALARKAKAQAEIERIDSEATSTPPAYSSATQAALNQIDSVKFTEEFKASHGKNAHSKTMEKIMGRNLAGKASDGSTALIQGLNNIEGISISEDDFKAEKKDLLEKAKKADTSPENKAAQEQFQQSFEAFLEKLRTILKEKDPTQDVLDEERRKNKAKQQEIIEESDEEIKKADADIDRGVNLKRTNAETIEEINKEKVSVRDRFKNASEKLGRAQTASKVTEQMQNMLPNEQQYKNMSEQDRTEYANVLKDQAAKLKEIDPEADTSAFDQAVENFEKGIATSGDEVGKAISELATRIREAAQKEFQGAKEEAITALNEADYKKKETQAQNEFNQADTEVQQAQKGLNSAQAEVKEAKKEVKKAVKGASPEEQEKALKKLADAEAKVAEETKKVEKAEGKRATALKKLNQIQETGVEMNEDNVKVMEEFGEANVKAGAATEDFNNNLDQTNKLGEKLKGSAIGLTSWSDSMGELISGAGQAVMGISMLSSAFQSLGESMASGDLTFSSFMSTLMSAGMALPMLISSFDQLSKIIKINKERTDANAASMEKNTVATKILGAAKKKKASEAPANAQKEEAADKKEMASSAGVIPVNVAEDASKGPAGWAIAAASLIMVGSLIGGIAGGIIQQKKDLRDEQYNEDMEEIRSSKEILDKNGELISSYQELSTEWKKSGEGRDELIKKAQEVAEAYNDEAIALALLAKQYEDLDDKIADARLAELNKAEKDTAQAQSRVTAATKSKAREGHGRKNAQGGFTVSFDEGFFSWLGWSDDDDATKTAIATLAGQGKLKYYDPDSNNLVLPPNYGLEEYVAGYEEIQALWDEADRLGADDTSELYRIWGEYLGEEQEIYENAKEALGLSNNIKWEQEVLETKSAQGNTIQHIQTQQEYNSYREDQLKGLDEDSDEYLAKLDFLSTYGGKFEEQAKTQELVLGKFEEAGFAPGNPIYEKAKEILLSGSEKDIQALILMANEGISGLSSIKELLDENREKRAEVAQAAAKSAFTQLKYSEEDADLYMEFLEIALKDIVKGNDEIIGWVAESTIVLNEKLKEFQKVWKEQAAIFVEGDTSNPYYSIGLNKLSDSFKSMLGIEDENVDLTGTLRAYSEEFIAFANGDIEQLRLLQAEAAKAVAEANGLGFSVFEGFSELADLDVELGQSIDDSNFLEQFNASIGNDQDFAAMEKALEAAGYAIAETEDLGNGIKKITKITRITDENTLAKTLEDVIGTPERYHEINEKLSDIEESLNRVNKVKERAFGTAALQAYDKSISLINDNLDAQKEKLAEAYDYLEKDANAAKALGVSIDPKTGRVNNYDQLSEEARKAADQYEDTLNLIQSENTALLELEYQLIDEHLAKVEKKFEDQAQLMENEMEMLEFQIERLGDSGFEAAQKISYLGKQLTSTFKQLGNVDAQATAELQGIFAGINKANPGLFSDADVTNITQQMMNGTFDPSKLNLTKEQEDAIAKNGAAFVETMNKRQSSMIEFIQSAEDYKEAIQDEVINSFDAWNEKIEENITLIEHQQALLEGYENIIDLLGDMGNVSKETMELMSQAQIETSRALLSTAKEQRDANREALLDAEILLSQGDITQEGYNEIAAAARESEEAFMDAWANSLEVATDQFESSVERILKTFSDALGDIEDMQARFDRQMEKEDFYLKAYEKTYEINKLNRQINSSIDNAQSVKANKALTEVQKELLSYQAAGQEMSDYDLQYLQKKYDLTLAQIALEEAQNAKSQVRLTRDAQGNYGYVYTADQGAVNDAEQKLDDAKYAMESFMDESQQSISSQYFELMQAWQDAISALDPTDPEYTAKVAEITAHYSELANMNLEEFSELLGRAKNLNNGFALGLVDDFKNTALGALMPQINQASDLATKVSSEMSAAIGDINTCHTAFVTNIEDAMKLADSSLSTFSNDVKNTVGRTDKTGIRGVINQTTDAVSNLAKKMHDPKEPTSLTSAMAEAHSKMNAFKNDIQPFIDAFTKTGGVADAIQQTIDKIQALKLELGLLETGGQGGTGSSNFGISMDNFKKSSYYSDGSWLGNSMSLGIQKMGGSGLSSTQQASVASWYSKLTDDQKYDLFKTSRTTGNFTEDQYKLMLKDNTEAGIQGAWSSYIDTQSVKNSEYEKSNDFKALVSAYESQSSYKLSQMDKEWIWKNILEAGSRTIEQDLTLFYDVNNGHLTQQGLEILTKGLKKGSMMYKNGNGGTHVPKGPYEIDDNLLYEYDPSSKTHSITPIRQDPATGAYFLLNPTEGLKQDKYYYSDKYGVLFKGSNAITNLYSDIPKISADYDSDYFSLSDLGGRQFFYIGPNRFIRSKSSTGDGKWYPEYALQEKNGKYRIAKGTLGYAFPENFVNFIEKINSSTFQYHPISGTLLKKFDTGGYTGAWGPEGRLAMLHQKEIVLNAADTENLLSTVQLVRSIVDRIKLTDIQAHYNSLMSSFKQNVTALIGSGGTLDQHVTIDAHFPNVTNSGEIENAFGNLVNLAAQYANR